MKKTFFEYIGIADMERIHSQLIAWAFSADFDSIDTVTRNKLFHDIFQIESESQIIRVYTEFNGIDILIETDKEVVIVENKLKTSQHSNQLVKYDVLCKKKYPKIPRYYFYLTLIGEKSNKEEWKLITYIDLFKHFKSLELTTSNGTVIFNEYLHFLERLTNIVEDFTACPSKYNSVFQNGSKKKEHKLKCQYESENEEFIAANQLETILQKSYLNSLSYLITSTECNISETRGDALIDFILQRHISYNGKKYATMIQLQEDTIKFVFAIQNNYTKSNKNWIIDIIPLMENLSMENKYGYTRLNKPKYKAYVSISKRLSEHYWHKDLNDLSEFLETEINNGREMTKNLINLLDSDLSF